MVKPVEWRQSKIVRPFVGWICSVYVASMLFSVISYFLNDFRKYPIFDVTQLLFQIAGEGLIVGFFVAIVVASFSALPSLILICWSEASRRNSLTLAIILGSLLARLTAAVITSFLDNPFVPTDAAWVMKIVATVFPGACGGWIYWLVAGRFAGMWQSKNE